MACVSNNDEVHTHIRFLADVEILARCFHLVRVCMLCIPNILYTRTFLDIPFIFIAIQLL